MKYKLKLAVMLLLGLTGLFLVRQPVAAQTTQGQPLVLVMNADGPLTPSMVGYLERTISIADHDLASLIIIQLNTPGGSISLMNQMITIMRNSDIPIVVYVSPQGAMAASAGTLITLAGHASAMAPETVIGAASPVGSQGEELGATLAAKEKAILEQTAVSLMARRPADAVNVAKDMIQNATAVSVDQALKVGLIDFIAPDLNSLLQQLNGFTLVVKDKNVTLDTQNALVQEVPLTIVEQALQLLTDPNIVFILLAIGVQSIFIELASPGGWVAGTIGVVCLALVVYSFGILPINLFGLVFIVLSFVLFIIDIKAPTHGALTAAGVASFIAGALILFNSTRVPGFPGVSIPLVIGVGLFFAASFSFIISFAVRALRLPARMGKKVMVGRTGVVSKTIDPVGSVQFQGELWTAELAEPGDPLPAGTRVEVVQVEGLRLKVRKAT